MKTLTEVPIEDLKKVVQARETIKNIEHKLFPFLKSDGQHDGDGNHNGHSNGKHHRRLSQVVRHKISLGMKRRWKERRKDSHKKEKGAATTS